MRTINQSQLLNNFLEQLGKKKTIQGTLWFLVQFIKNEFDCEEVNVYEFIENNNSLRLLAKNTTDKTKI